MSAHDARFDDSPTDDSMTDEERGTTITRIDEPVDRDDEIADGDPVLLPVDPSPEPTEDDGRDTTADDAPLTIVDAGDGIDVKDEHSDDATHLSDDTTDVTDGADRPKTTPDAADVSVGPDTETGALKDPVPDGSFFASESPAPESPAAEPISFFAPESPAAEPISVAASEPVASVDDGWRDLQGQFVDDPESAVREAGAKVEQALADLRVRLESGSTEDLRTAFRRYRDLHSALS